MVIASTSPNPDASPRWRSSFTTLTCAPGPPCGVARLSRCMRVRVARNGAVAAALPGTAAPRGDPAEWEAPPAGDAPIADPLAHGAPIEDPAGDAAPIAEGTGA